MRVRGMALRGGIRNEILCEIDATVQKADDDNTSGHEPDKAESSTFQGFHFIDFRAMAPSARGLADDGPPRRYSACRG